MNDAPPLPTMQYRGVTLCADPAREPCFKIVHQHYEVWMPTLAQPADPTGREGLHSLYNSEVLSLEIAAQSLADFPDAPWELRLNLARHCWDEARHATLLIQRLAELGCHKGDFPIINHEYNVVCSFPSLAARIAVQNRTFEGGSLDGFHASKNMFDAKGDTRTVAIFASIMADEVEHARFGNDWTRRLCQLDPRNVLRIAQAINTVKHIAKVLATQPGEVVLEGRDLAAMRHAIDIHQGDRRAAGFTTAEIAGLAERDARNAASTQTPAP